MMWQEPLAPGSIRSVLGQDTFLSQGFSALRSEMGTRELVGEIQGQQKQYS